jgi:monofunctional biosynthetic peptidoglycan transglycosylase
MKASSSWRALVHWAMLMVVAFMALQLYFVGRIALMAWVDPQSSSFERSEAWRLSTETGHLRWRQQWVPYAQLSDHLKRAVIASEDGAFVNHDGVEWEAMEKAWQKNAKAEEKVQAQVKKATEKAVQKPNAAIKLPKPPKIIGGSTITQQLAKNLFLSGERTLLRKGQEFVLTLLLEALLDKQRILELYLNHVEWGEGVFGAEAASQHYYRKSAVQLSAYEAARLAVMLPRPRYFEKLPNSTYLSSRAQTIAARMRDAELP